MGLTSEETEALYAELNERGEVAVILQPVVIRQQLIIYKIVRSRFLVYEFSFIDIF